MAAGEHRRLFEGHVNVVNVLDKAIQPVIRGSAYVTAEATLILDEHLVCGARPSIFVVNGGAPQLVAPSSIPGVSKVGVLPPVAG